MRDEIGDMFARFREMLEEAEARGYARGREDAITAITAAARNVAVPAAPAAPALVKDEREAQDETQRQRAPRGLARKVCMRALLRKDGMMPREIEATAEGDMERMISASSFRSELRNGREHGLYRDEGGKWFLTEEGEAEALRLASEDAPASFSNKGVGSHAAALADDPDPLI